MTEFERLKERVLKDIEALQKQINDSKYLITYSKNFHELSIAILESPIYKYESENK